MSEGCGTISQLVCIWKILEEVDHVDLPKIPHEFWPLVIPPMATPCLLFEFCHSSPYQEPQRLATTKCQEILISL